MSRHTSEKSSVSYPAQAQPPQSWGDDLLQDFASAEGVLGGPSNGAHDDSMTKDEAAAQIEQQRRAIAEITAKNMLLTKRVQELQQKQ